MVADRAHRLHAAFVVAREGNHASNVRDGVEQLAGHGPRRDVHFIVGMGFGDRADRGHRENRVADGVLGNEEDAAAARTELVRLNGATPT